MLSVSLTKPSFFFSSTGETLNNFSIEVLMSPHDDPPATCHHQATAVIDTVFFTCRPSLKGRLVRIRMMEPSQHGKIIALCEVEVIGTKIGNRYRMGQYICVHCMHAKIHIYIRTYLYRCMLTYIHIKLHIHTHTHTRARAFLCPVVVDFLRSVCFLLNNTMHSISY